MPFDTHDKVDGNITLRLQGTLTTSCVSESCAYTFKGSLSAYDDPYDFNKAHRGVVGEGLTAVGRHTHGREYMIEIRGHRDITESGVAP